MTDKHYLDLNRAEVDVPPLARAKLVAALEDYAFYSSGMKEMEEGKKSAAKTIISILQGTGVDGVDEGSLRYQLSTTTSKRINKERLLERGVSVDIISYATDTSTSEPYLRVSKMTR